MLQSYSTVVLKYSMHTTHTSRFKGNIEERGKLFDAFVPQNLITPRTDDHKAQGKSGNGPSD